MEEKTEGEMMENRENDNVKKEMVILVDDEDNDIGLMEKLEAHQKGKLHRAFSIFVFNPKGEMLIQRRDLEKYHCGGIWANTCCSHPRKDEVISEAVHRRLKEEMGFDTGLREAFKFTYYSKFDNGLIEYETDHVFVGIWDPDRSDKGIVMNKEEVMDYKWIKVSDLAEDIKKRPEIYAPWFKVAVEKMGLGIEIRNRGCEVDGECLANKGEINKP